MKKAFEYPAKRAAFEKFVSENEGCFVWHDGAVMRVFTGDDAVEAQANLYGNVPQDE